MKLYVENWNGVLDTLIDKLDKSGELVTNPHDADAFLLWQDVRGDMLRLSVIVKQMKKPLFVMQHGRGATRDYCPPNNFKMEADKILVWGQTEKDRLLTNGIVESRIEIVGCPLFKRLLPRNKEKENINILYVPVIAQKEEPENLMVHAALKIWENHNMIVHLSEYYEDFKKGWAYEFKEMRPIQVDGKTEHKLWNKQVRPILPRGITFKRGLINCKLSSVHDAAQYQSPLMVSSQNSPYLIDQIAELLTNIDIVVGLEEGTLQLLACALDIPCLTVDIFKYGNYGGCENYDRVEKIKTNSCHYTTKLSKVGDILDNIIKNPQELKKAREDVCELEGGLSFGDVDENIIKAISKHINKPSKTLELVAA